MPTYQYRCTECGNDLEAVQKFTDDALTECPACSGVLRKVFSAVGVVFKGSGFYKTDSRSNGSGSKAGSSNSSNGDGGNSSGSSSDSSTSSDSSSSNSSDSSSSSSSSSSESGSKTPASTASKSD